MLITKMETPHNNNIGKVSKLDTLLFVLSVRRIFLILFKCELTIFHLFITKGLGTTLPPTTSPFSQSIISHDNLIVDCNSPQAKVKDYCISSCFSSNEHILLQDIFSDHSMMDINIKHFLFRDGTQVWIAPSFHYAGKLEL